MAQIDMKQTAVGNVVAPGSGYNSLFVDANGQLWTLNSSGGQLTPTDGIASRTSATAAIANTETQVIGATVLANTLTAGSTIRFKAAGTWTSSVATTASIFRIRINAATLGANAQAALTLGTSLGTTNTALNFTVEGQVTAYTATTARGWLQVNVTDIATYAMTTRYVSIAVQTSDIAIVASQNNVAELTYISGNASASATFHNASIELVK